MRHRISHLWLFLLAFAWTLVSAAPTPFTSSTETVYRRQRNGDEQPITEPEVTTTVQVVNTFVRLAFSLYSLSNVVVELPGLLQRHALSR